jgi:invasion protein IalB
MKKGMRANISVRAEKALQQTPVVQAVRSSYSMMKTSKPNGRVFWGAAQVLLLQLGSSNAASAQTAPAPVVPSSASLSASGEKPQRTTASYDDWILQCDKKAGPPPENVCEIAQVVQAQLQGKNVPFSLIAIPRPVNPKLIKMMVQLPVNVSLRGNVILRTDKADPGIATPFARCVVSGCVAEFDLKEDAVKKLRSAAAVGSIAFKNSNEQDVVVPLSLKGLAPALDALAKE